MQTLSKINDLGNVNTGVILKTEDGDFICSSIFYSSKYSN